MSESAIYPTPEAWKKRALTDNAGYEKSYAASIDDPETFWAEQAQRIDWMRPFSKVKDVSYAQADLHINWYADGELNVAANCLDRHLAERAEQTAIIWEPDNPEDDALHISYAELHRSVCRFANVLKARGIEKGDIVTIYMPMIPEAAMAMLACARIGAVHSVVFGGFSPEALASRIEDGQSKLIITADEGPRGGKAVPLKGNVDAACDLPGAKTVNTVLVVQRTGADVNWQADRDVWYHEAIADVAEDCPAVAVNAEHPLFILYTSGSTGKPKGVQHSSGGYLVYASLTHEQVFDYQEGDIYWCAADVGWITGHSYIVYGPLANGATMLMFEGVPNWPDASRMGQIIDRHQVNTLYTAPTAIRALMQQGDAALNSERSSLRLLGSVGEPINPEAWSWYHHKFGQGQCPIVDTWWQTETGGIMITPLPGATDLKPGSATRPFYGIQPVLLDDQGQVVEWSPGKEIQGNLCISDSWPGQMRTVYGDHERFIQTYFSAYEGYYFSGDGARRDADGYFWITGRVDDVINVSGHRMGTAEVESALVAHPAVAEAAVVGYPHDIKGQGIYVYVTLQAGYNPNDELKAELKQQVRKEIGPIAVPDLLQWAPGLPKTRSGKIMRRILRKIAENDYGSLGDTSTLADPAVVDELIENRQNR